MAVPEALMLQEVIFDLANRNIIPCTIDVEQIYWTLASHSAIPA